MRWLLLGMMILSPSVLWAADPDALPPGAIARLGSNRFRGHAVVSPDGKRLVVNNDHDTTVYELPTLKELRKLLYVNSNQQLKSPDLIDARFLNDRYLATRPYYVAPGYSVWDVETGSRILHQKPEEVASLLGHRIADWGPASLDREGKLFLCEHRSDDVPVQYHVFQAKPLKLLRTIRAIHIKANWALLSADGATLVCGGCGKTLQKSLPLQVFDTASGRERVQIHDGNSAVDQSRYAIGPDGKRIASTNGDSLRIIDATNGKLLHQIEYRYKFPDVVRFDRSGQRLLVIGESAIRVFDAEKGQLTGNHEWPYRAGSPFHESTQVEFPPKGNPMVVHAQQDRFEVWELESGKLVLPPCGHMTIVDAIQFSPDGSRLHSADKDSGYLEWNVARRTSNQPRPRSFQAIAYEGLSRPQFNSDASRYYQGFDEFGTIHAWNTADGKSLFRLHKPQEVENWQQVHFRCSPNGSAFLTLHAQITRVREKRHELTVRDQQTGEIRVKLGLQDVEGLEALFTPDSKRLVIASYNSYHAHSLELSLWDLQTKQRLRSVAMTRRGMPELLITPDGCTAIVVSEQRAVRFTLWNLESGTLRERPHTNDEFSLSSPPFMSPNGKCFAVPLLNRNMKRQYLRIYETASQSERLAFATPTCDTRIRGPVFVTSLAISPDARTVAAGIMDGTILLYDVSPNNGPKPWEKSPSDPVELWKQLADGDAAKAWPAMRELIHRPDVALKLFAERMKPLTAAEKPKAEQLKTWIEQLASPKFQERDEATKALRKVGRLIEPELRAVVKKVADPEAAQRLEGLIERLDKYSPEELREVRSVEVLEWLASPVARKLLESWSVSAESTVLGRESRFALTRKR
jgi:WD40 repeat protein